MGADSSGPSLPTAPAQKRESLAQVACVCLAAWNLLARYTAVG